MGCGRPAALVAITLAFTSQVAVAQPSGPPMPVPIGQIHDKLRAAGERQEGAASSYARMKKQIADDTGITFAMDVSVINQWGAPHGAYAAVQALFTPNLNWQAFADTALGRGSFQFAYLAAQYWSAANAASLADSLDLNSPLNAWPANVKYFKQMTYTHEFPGRWLSVTLGQYPFASFDGNAYANDQQASFISNSLSQNGSKNYSKASLGAYVQLDPVRDLTLAAGFHDGTNLTGSYIQLNTIGQGAYAWFLYGAWSPDVATLGRGQYLLFYYNLPSVPAQPRASDGLSFSASQPIGSKWGLFLRANTAWNSSFAVQSSVAGGAVYNDPLGRGSGDRIGLGLAWNRTNLSLAAATFARASETMLELYWNWSLAKNLIFTPDIQLYLQPALSPSEQLAAVFTIRVTKLF